ncbi:hypothetical protein NDU88_002630 [Pleurodeles waltl]|uniref:DUF4200 domain-containing protein n=1 Tax=Pleurodeles waltl TaxID=8319 RepID=A0AAV7MNY4_PLEWA|nr:hypothetical protein NDU88_002630 [Pleurodeles waltl]
MKRDDPRYLLHVENTKRNVFVTQLGEGRDDEDESITCIPVITEPASKILETSKNTLQRTLVLKKEVEFDDVSAQLLAKQQEFRERMQIVELRKFELAKRQKENNDKVEKFDGFVKDNHAKRRRAIQKYQQELKQNEIKKKQLEELTQQLEEMRVRQKKLQKKISKYKTYEDYLRKILHKLPDNYLDQGIDAPLKAIIIRHEALAATNQSLIDNLMKLSDRQEANQRALQTLQREHDTSTLMMSSELSQLHATYEKLQDKNKQLELNISLSKGHFRYQSVELSHLLLAVANLAEQCHMHHYGPLQELALLRKLDMIKEYILEKMQVLQISRGPAETESYGSSPREQSKKTKTVPKKEKLQINRRLSGPI